MEIIKKALNNKMVCIFVSETEYNELIFAADDMKMSMTDYIMQYVRPCIAILYRNFVSQFCIAILYRSVNWHSTCNSTIYANFFMARILQLQTMCQRMGITLHL